MQTLGDRQNYKSSRYLKEFNVQNVGYLMQFSSCSEKRSTLICFQKTESRMGYSFFPGVCSDSDSQFADVLASGVPSIMSM